MNLWFYRFSISPKKLFLVDGIGALLSAFFLGVILTSFENYIGMPKLVLYVLAVLACVFGVYSFCCYVFIDARWRIFLQIIAATNLLYCCLTLGLVIVFFPRLTPLGVAYFVLELFIVLILIYTEFEICSKNVKNSQ